MHERHGGGREPGEPRDGGWGRRGQAARAHHVLSDHRGFDDVGVGHRWAVAEVGEEVTGEQMIAGMKQMAARAESRGTKLIAATLTPFGNETYMANAWNPTRERHRVTLNTWIRESGAFHGVVDFDAAIRDPDKPTQMLGIYDCGDGLHPSDIGYCKLGDAIDLALFD